MVREAFQSWKQSTLLITKLSAIHDENRRDEVIQTIDYHLEKRETLLPQMKAPFTEEERALKEELVALERKMNTSLNEFTRMIKGNLSEMKAKKGTAKNYMNPYDKVARDGTYYDAKQ